GGEDIALLKNTSEGICIVANGIDWKDGDNIVTARGEFISNQLAWQALSAKGVELRKVDILNCDDPESALLNAMDDRTRVLTVSSVQWNSGFRLDLRKLGKACRNSNTLFFVDAIQQFGALQIDVQDCGIDVLAASAHKWMMGPEGIAIFYCNAKTRKKLVLRQYGWLMLNDPFRYDLPDREPTSSARRFEAGTPNNIGQAGLFASLGLLSDVGHEVVERLVLSNTAKLMAALHQIKGVTVQSRTETSRHSGIVSFAANGIESEQLRRKLAKMNVHVAVRGSAVRLSPHFYQCSETIDQLLNCIELAIRNDKIH
ncbi:MAG: cysteine desulfurase/selenocysteine lyase, partial [Bacteroidia bacterium]